MSWFGNKMGEFKAERAQEKELRAQAKLAGQKAYVIERKKELLRRAETKAKSRATGSIGKSFSAGLTRFSEGLAPAIKETGSAVRKTVRSRIPRRKKQKYVTVTHRKATTKKRDTGLRLF